MKEKIEVKKAFRGFIDPINYIKTIVFSGNLIIMIAVCLGIYTAIGWFFPKKNNQSQTTGITIEKGASVTGLVIQNKQESDKQLASLEMSASSDDITVMFKRYINSRWHYGFGAKWEYEEYDNGLPVKPQIRLGVDF